MEPTQAKFEGWAIVEMMGHQREIGFVVTEAYGTAVLFRVDVPEIPEHDFELTRTEWGKVEPSGDDRYLAPGTKVRRPRLPARTRLISPAAVYAINPCTEDVAHKALENLSSRALICLELPKVPLIEAAPLDAEDDDEDGEVHGHDGAIEI